MFNLMSAVLVGGLAVLAFVGGVQAKPKESYAAQLSKWRAEQTQALTRPEGFLSVAGLDWLQDGENTVGSDASSAVRLSASAVPTRLGILNRVGGLITLKVEPGVSVHVTTDAGGTKEVVGSRTMLPITLRSDSTRVSVGKVSFMIITRGSRVGVRVFDTSCRGYREFKGQKWYAANPRFVVEAKFVPYSPPKMVDITNVIGDKTPVPIVGYVEFTLDGKVCRLDAQGAGDGLFLNFKDLTSGKTTYPAGRFLDTPGPVDGKVLIDFNKATNPPCAFTAFATCPLPPAGNTLEVAVPAGEKTHHPVHE